MDDSILQEALALPAEDRRGLAERTGGLLALSKLTLATWLEYVDATL